MPFLIFCAAARLFREQRGLLFTHAQVLVDLGLRGARRAMLTFVWTKTQSATPSNIDWELKIIGMDDDLAEAIQNQVNSVSSLAEDPGAAQAEIDEDLRMREEEAALFSE